MTREKVFFGLDFGTSKSIMACTKNGKTQTVNYEAEFASGLPSLFWRNSEGEEFLCDIASSFDATINDPLGVCSSIKMKLKLPEIVLHDHKYSPSQIATSELKYILEKSKSCFAEDFINMDFDTLVVGVPVTFDAATYGELLNIMEEVTGNKKIRLVPEPILAAIAYNQMIPDGKKRNILVFDMGAGTFDCTYLRPNQNISSEHPFPYIADAQAGSDIAGDHIDKIIYDIVISKLKKNKGFPISQYKESTAAGRFLKNEVRIKKEKLSKVDKLSYNVSYAGCASAKIELSRKDIEDRIIPEIILKAINLTEKVLTDAKAKDFDIILVGGSTYIPCVKETLLKELGEKYNLTEDNILHRFPEKAVAMGAAIFAESPDIVNVTKASGFGYLVHENRSHKEVISICIPSGVNVPYEAINNYSTFVEGQTSVRLTMFEVNDAEMNKNVDYDLSSGRIHKTQYEVIHDFRKKVPVNTPIRVRTILSENLTLTIEVDDLGINDDVTVKHFCIGNVTTL